MQVEKYEFNVTSIVILVFVLLAFNFIMLKTFKEKRFYKLSVELNHLSEENRELKDELKNFQLNCSLD